MLVHLKTQLLNSLQSCSFPHYRFKKCALYLPGLTGIGGKDIRTLGIPSLDEYLGAYNAMVPHHKAYNFDFYMAFVHFRGGAVMNGVYSRALKGK